VSEHVYVQPINKFNSPFLVLTLQSFHYLKTWKINAKTVNQKWENQTRTCLIHCNFKRDVIHMELNLAPSLALDLAPDLTLDPTPDLALDPTLDPELNF
jgi:hypothetical protein